ncbi:aminotransferase class I/II-fold pyridoxal phosphate-dependent enzyme, partial [bacterium]|nr:aminotransferase class I/II-fold pyridoxal phosphate-dependent enzyme [bacterium]
MERVDLRSDTVTQPDEAMRRAIAEAEVGDDVFGDDPTVNLLQERMAGLLGKEAALLVPSGTMANQTALRSLTRAGDQVVCEDGAHVYRYEAGAPAALSGLLLTTIVGRGGSLRWADIAPHLNTDDVHCAPPSLICLENTHNRAGGRVLPQEDVADVGREAHARGLALHLDGARLWNAHVATGRALSELAAPADTVSVCFSKGLGAPVGSILAGPRDMIARARRARKLFGGGMRQAGILAAACLYALDHNLPRLADDHRRARRLAEGLDNPAISLDHAVETNIVIYRTSDEAGLLDHLRERGVLGVSFGRGRVRLVTNLMVDDDQIV